MDFQTLQIHLFCLSMQVGAGFPSWSLTFWSLLLLTDLISNYVHVFFLIQIVWGLDQVTLLNPPEEPLSDHHLKILYSCDEPATVQLDCIVSFDTGIISTLLLRRWSCVPGDPKIRTVQLKLPDWLVYQADGIVPDSQWVLSCILLASVRYSGFDDIDRSVAVQDVATLQPKPFYNRPVKQHKLCIAWSTEMLQLTQRFSKKQCPLEQGKIRQVIFKMHVWAKGPKVKNGLSVAMKNSKFLLSTF